MPTHVVQEGEGLSSIAASFGFFPLTVWRHSANAGLRATRPDPDILAPGDELFIPVKEPRVEPCVTAKRHRFRRRGVPSILRLQVIIAGEVRANQPYELVVDGGPPRRGHTDGEGILQEGVPPQSRSAVLTIGPDGHRFELGLHRIDPVDTVPGVRGRLNNLGFFCGEGPQVDDGLRAAVRLFQAQAGLPVNGAWDDAPTAQALQRFHETSENLPDP